MIFFTIARGRPRGVAGIVRQMPYLSPQLSPEGEGGVGHIIDRCIRRGYFDGGAIPTNGIKIVALCTKKTAVNFFSIML